MSTTSFKKKPATAEEGSPPSEETTQPLAKVEDGTVALPNNDEEFSGSWGRDDVRLPRINLVHKTSANELIKKFGIGSFALNKEVKLSDGETPIVITALRAAKDFAQKLPYGSSETPTVYKDEEEVEAHGGSLNYKDAESGNFYQPRAHIQFVFPAPESVDEEGLALFPYEFNGVNYAMALMTVSSSAFTSVGKELATLKTNNKVMRKGLRFGRLALTSETRKNSKNEWAVPVIKYTGENPADLIAFFEGLL